MSAERSFEASDESVRQALSGLSFEAMPGEIARAIRQARKLSLKDVANLVGFDTHFTTIGKLETGKRKFSADWGNLLANALEVPTHAFFDPQGAFLPALRVPIYTNIEQVRAHPHAAADNFDYFRGTRKLVFGLFITGQPDLVREFNPQTVLIDPTATDLVDGWVYLFSKRETDEFTIGIYRDDLHQPRIVPWPNLSAEFLPLTDDVHVLGRVFEVRRHVASAHS